MANTEEMNQDVPQRFVLESFATVHLSESIMRLYGEKEVKKLERQANQMFHTLNVLKEQLFKAGMQSTSNTLTMVINMVEEME